MRSSTGMWVALVAAGIALVSCNGCPPQQCNPATDPTCIPAGCDAGDLSCDPTLCVPGAVNYPACLPSGCDAGDPSCDCVSGNPNFPGCLPGGCDAGDPSCDCVVGNPSYPGCLPCVAGNPNYPGCLPPQTCDGGPCPTCVALTGSCSVGGLPCCSGQCLNGTCTIPCTQTGIGCQNGFECCTGTCNGSNVCGCSQTGQGCTAGDQCCSRTCGVGSDAGMQCLSLPGATCGITGAGCLADNQCCSNNCLNSMCTPVFSCQAYHDVCVSGGDCCSFQCNKVGPATAGTCNEPTGAGSCNGAGNPCTQGSDCCSRVCADFGTGGLACQPTIGCRPQGDNCATSSSCCGSANCEASNKCDNGISCRGAGMICGKPTQLLPDGGLGGCARLLDGGCYTVVSETNCCESNKVQGDEYLCRVDVGGVPRCFGGISGPCPNGYTGDPGCCIAAGNYCDFRDQCCNGLPCTVGADGGRQCVAPTCIAVGAICNPAASNCCSGTTCGPDSEGLTNICQVPDAGSCTGNTGTCSSPAQCCSRFCDATGHCVPAPTCQPQGASCSAAADCCTNPPLNCVFGSGTTGTCQPGATCLNIGQACTITSSCCLPGQLVCVDSTATECFGTVGCTCQVNPQ